MASGIFFPFLFFPFFFVLFCFVLCALVIDFFDGDKRSEDPGDEEEAFEPTVQIADQPFFKMADGKLQRPCIVCS